MPQNTVSIWHAQFHTLYTGTVGRSVSAHYITFPHTQIFTKKQKLQRNPTGKHGWPWGWKLIKHISLFTSTQQNCVYWEEPTVATSVIWLHYGISNRGTAVRFPAQVQFISTERRPPGSGTTQLPTQRLPGAVSHSVQRPGRAADHWCPSKSGEFRSESSCTSTPSKGFKTLTGTILCVLRVRSSWPKSLQRFKDRQHLPHL